MNNRVDSPTDETGATPAPSNEDGRAAKVAPRDFLGDTRRKLTHKEAASAAGIQWFQYEIERLDSESNRLKAELTGMQRKNDALTENYNDKRVELEALKGRMTLSIRNEILSTLVIAAGSAGTSVTSIYLNQPAVHVLALAGFVLSLLLIVSGIILRAWK